MELTEFQHQLTVKLNRFSDIRKDIADMVNSFIADNEKKINITYNGVVEMTDIESKIDDMAMFSAWIEDRLNGNCGIPNHSGYNKSRAKKVRKAFGYTF